MNQMFFIFPKKKSDNEMIFLYTSKKKGTAVSWTRGLFEVQIRQKSTQSYKQIPG